MAYSKPINNCHSIIWPLYVSRRSVHRHQTVAWMTICSEGISSLRWRHNERDGVSNHRRLECWHSRLFRRSSNIKAGLFGGNPQVTGGFPSQRARTRKTFPFDDVIMLSMYGISNRICTQVDFDLLNGGYDKSWFWMQRIHSSIFFRVAILWVTITQHYLR